MTFTASMRAVMREVYSADERNILGNIFGCREYRISESFANRAGLTVWDAGTHRHSEMRAQKIANEKPRPKGAGRRQSIVKSMLLLQYVQGKLDRRNCLVYVPHRTKAHFTVMESKKKPTKKIRSCYQAHQTVAGIRSASETETTVLNWGAK